MKIIDTTTFFEEHLMMDLRFNILDPFVDKFVVCEARFSHSGKEKEIKFNKKDYPKFEEKIIHLIIDDDPIEKNLSKEANPSVLRLNSIQRIEAQRNHIAKALANEDRENYIIYSDNDEIPRFENINLEKNKNKIIAFNQKLFYYKFNLFCDRIEWHGTRGCKKKHLKSFTWLRDLKIKNYPIYRIDTLFSDTKYTNIKIVKNGGWHFSQVKSPEDIYKKLTNSEDHAEFKANKQTLSDIKDMVKRKVINFDHQAKSKDYKYSNEFKLKTLPIKDMPIFIQKNSDKYSEWLDLM